MFQLIAASTTFASLYTAAKLRKYFERPLPEYSFEEGRQPRDFAFRALTPVYTGYVSQQRGHAVRKYDIHLAMSADEFRKRYFPKASQKHIDEFEKKVATLRQPFLVWADKLPQPDPKVFRVPYWYMDVDAIQGRCEPKDITRVDRQEFERKFYPYLTPKEIAIFEEEYKNYEDSFYNEEDSGLEVAIYMSLDSIGEFLNDHYDWWYQYQVKHGKVAPGGRPDYDFFDVLREGLTPYTRAEFERKFFARLDPEGRTIFEKEWVKKVRDKRKRGDSSEVLIYVR